MKVTDLNGCPIEATDLNEVIRITKRYTRYKHEDKSFSDFDKKQKVYWTDMYGKLTAMKIQLQDNKKLENHGKGK